MDNNSTDDSVFRIRASELADELIINRENLGYAAGNNVGIQFAIQRFVFDVIIVLNNDTIVSPGAISRLAQSVANESWKQAVSPLIRYANSTGVWFGGGVIDHGWPRHLQGSELIPTSERLRLSQTLSGCCIAAHRHTWMKVGLFDRSYFLIFEDSEWSARAQRRGVALRVVTDAEIRHKVSASFHGDSRLLGGYYFVRNGLRYVARYHTRHVPRFLWTWLIRPTVARIAHRTITDGLFFRWAGFGAFLLHRWGSAPPSLERRAKR